MPLHTLRADIDFGQAEARTTYGVIGVKVWIYRGDVAPTARAEPTRRRGARAGWTARTWRPRRGVARRWPPVPVPGAGSRARRPCPARRIAPRTARRHRRRLRRAPRRES